MSYIIKGSICGYLCEECSEPLSGIEVLLYLPWEKEKVLQNTVARTKDTFRLVTKDEISSKQKLLIATSKTDEKGNYEFVLDEKHKNSAFDIDFICGTVPHTPPKPRKEQLQFHLTTIYPEWKIDKQRESFYYIWNYCIISKWWCYIRGHYFDAWVICGHLRNCETGSPVANAIVKAWDADLFTDDYLGSAITDASGHFRIDYTSADFKVNFIPLNIETDPAAPFFSSGPDVYFKAEIGGTKLIDETSADRRNNVGYCLCVDLCTKINVGDPGDNFPSAWTGIGDAFDISTGAGPRDFDVNGYAGAGSGKFGLSGVIDLTGQADNRAASGNPIEYRFLISHLTTLNGAPPPPLANFTKIIGVTPGLFAPGIVATLIRFSPFTIIKVISAQSDFDADGWFDVNSAIERALTTHGFTLSDLNSFALIDDDTLISLNTGALTTAPDVPTGVANAGNPIPAANKIPVEKVAIRFEIREVVNKALNNFNIIAGSGTTLNSAIINNNPVFMKLAITELETAGSCTPISGTVHAKYTIYHPHLRSASMHLNNNSHTVERDITGDGFLTLSGNINPLIDGNANNSLQLNNPPNDMIKCTYSLKLYAQARLHDGRNAWGNSGPLEELFFYNV